MNAPSDGEETIFEKALGIADPEARDAYLREACGAEAALLERLRGLLQAHDRAGRFLENSQAEPALFPTQAAAALAFGVGASGPPTESEATTVHKPTEQPGHRIGRYRLLEQIGEGGMGTVWMAEQEEPVRRRVALKIIKLGMDTRQVVARFEAERQALALMDHPNIARALDGGATEEGRPYFVMELVHGLPITRYCDELKLSTSERLQLFVLVCRAVQHAHQKGIIHRDLKPSNILVTEQDGRSVPKVIDFGIAKATEGRLTDKTLFTGFQQVIGTPAYMSPEQAGLGRLDVDTRSDTYSLGVLLYQLLTGHTPFDTQALLKEGYEAVMRTIREVDPPRPSTRLSTLQQADGLTAAGRRRTDISKLVHLLRGDLDWIVMKALEKDRSRRYETADGLALDLERFLHDEPVMARPPSTVYRWQKFARKHRTGVLVAAGFVLVLVSAAVVSTSLALWAMRERAGASASDAESRSVLRFFQEKILAAARPEGEQGGLGHDITLRAAVDAAEPQIAKEFIEQPLVEAAIRDVLGDTYIYLGDYAAALPQHERAWQLLNASLGPDHTNTLGAAHGIAVDLHELGRPAEAVPWFEQILQRRQRNEGSNSLQTLRSQCTLGSACRAAGQIPRAVLLLEQACSGLRIHFGPENPFTLDALNLLALAYRDADRPGEMLQLLEQILEARQRAPEPKPAELVPSMMNLARGYMDTGRPDKAVPLVGPALQLAQDKFGTNHPSTLNLLNTRGWLNFTLGHFDLALTQLEQALEATIAKLGSNHLETAGSMTYLANARLVTGNPKESIRLSEEVLRIRRASLGPTHADTLSSLCALAISHRKVGNLDRALALAEEAWAQQTQQLGAGHVSALISMDCIILIHVATNRLNEALALFARAMELRQAKEGPLDSDVYATATGLAEACFQAQCFDGAEHSLNAVVNSRHQPGTDDYLISYLTVLGQASLRQKKYAEAEAPLRICLPIFEQVQPGVTPTYQLQAMLGWTLLGQKKYAEAEPLLLDSYQGLKQREAIRRSGSRSEFLKEFIQGVSQLYDDSGKTDKATEWKTRLPNG